MDFFLNHIRILCRRSSAQEQINITQHFIMQCEMPRMWIKEQFKLGDLFRTCVVVQISLRLNACEAVSRLEGHSPQWTVLPGIIEFINYFSHHAAQNATSTLNKEVVQAGRCCLHLLNIVYVYLRRYCSIRMRIVCFPFHEISQKYKMHTNNLKRGVLYKCFKYL